MIIYLRQKKIIYTLEKSTKHMCISRTIVYVSIIKRRRGPCNDVTLCVLMIDDGNICHLPNIHEKENVRYTIFMYVNFVKDEIEL